MRIFIDTEFTTLNSSTSKLMSLGMVCGDKTLYVEVDGWHDRDLSAFTRSIVVPQMTMYLTPLADLSDRIYTYLAQFDGATIATDSLDWDWWWLLQHLPRGIPENIEKHPLLLTMNYLNNYDLFEKHLNYQFNHVYQQHHALNDAKALQAAWRLSGGDIFEKTDPQPLG